MGGENKKGNNSQNSDTSSLYDSSNDDPKEADRKGYNIEDEGKDIEELEKEQGDLLDLLMLPNQEIKTPKMKRVEAPQVNLDELVEQRDNLLADLMNVNEEENQNSDKDTVYSDDSDEQVKVEFEISAKKKDEEKELEELIKEKEDLINDLFQFDENQEESQKDKSEDYDSSYVSELKLDDKKEENYFLSDDE